MKIIKYEKKSNGKYLLYLDNNEKVELYEDTILKNNLLYKKEINKKELSTLIEDNNISNIYNKCINYISVRIRSTKEIYDYLKKYTTDEDLIEEIIDKLTKNKLLNDSSFAGAFVKDKWHFTTMGPYRIKNELKIHNISNEIIEEEINKISEEEIITKLEKQLNKIIKSTKKKETLRNKAYNNLISLGYSIDNVLEIINKYNL